MTATQDDTIAALQRANAELRRERDAALAQRDSAMAQRTSDYDERTAYQAATIDVLKAMSASPGDPQPVFDLIVDRARDLCDAYGATVFEFDGTGIHWRAATGVSDDPAVRAAYEAQFPMVPARGWAFGRAILDRRIIRIDDMEAEPGLDPTLRGITAKSNVTTPIMRGDEVIGAIGMGSREKGGFSDSQVELLKTFAEQAAIAITSAETYRALQVRTSDLQQSLEYQTATSDVLKVISRSTFDLQPVLDTVVGTAARLCAADSAQIAMREGDACRNVAAFSFSPEYDALARGRLVPMERGHISGRTMLEGQVVHVADIASDSEYTMTETITVGGYRTMLGVPLWRSGKVVGTINLGRRRVEPFSDRQIELVRTFADQAIIAIENTRLITEQREALEQQTATAEVLQVINASPGNLGPVFAEILERATNLCEPALGMLWTYDGEQFFPEVVHGPPAFVEFYRDRPRLRAVPGSGLAKHVAGEDVIRAADIADDPLYQQGNPRRRAYVELGRARSAVSIALRKDGNLFGAIQIYRQEIRPFSDKEIALLENFAAQAVIAMENARLITEQREALEQQTATAEVLQVINANTGNLEPVFDAILEKAHGLCGVAMGSLELYDGQRFRAVAVRGLSDAFADMLRQGYPAFENPATGPLIDGGRLTHIRDLAETDYAITRSGAELDAGRTLLCVPLRREGTLLGMIASGRKEVRPFSDKEIALLENFAAQAVIAMENARLINEQREALEQQTATADVLRAINASPGELAPVFDVIGEKAIKLCDAAAGALMLPDGDRFRAVALGGVPEAYAEFCRNSPAYGRPNPGSLPARMLAGDDVVHIKDITDVDEYAPANTPSARALAELGGGRTLLGVALRKDSKFFGMITIFRQEVKPFSDRQIALLRSFADQAVIAMENARLLEEVRQRQEELRITFENMGDGVAMFDEPQHLVAWNRKFREIFNVPDALLEEHRTYAEYVRYLGTRGDFGPTVDVEEQIRRFTETAGEYHSYERDRPDGRVIEIRHNPVPGGGFVLIYADITERKRNEAEIRAARDAAEEASRTIEAAYRELKTAQANLIQAEKMASLGQLTAGIAHEIKNPLNFVNNFAALSVDLLSELKETAAPGFAALTEDQRADIDDVSAMLTSNLEKITEHGKRADGIVKAMLEHSRGSSAERRRVDLNAVIDEALNLAYHGARAQDQSFNITLERDFGEGIAPIEVNPQDITRVFLNIFSNGFYAATKRARATADAGFVPTLRVTTRGTGDTVEIRVRDNGTGIPADIRDKLFQPFFTTKPTGEGTGLGLSITYDIVTQQHGGHIAVDSKVGDYSEFTIRLPRNL